MNKTIYILDGSQFSSLDEFAEYFSKHVLKDYRWRGNLDAFNDIMSGGFGTPEEGFVLQWENSTLSRTQLGYDETVKWFQERVTNCHPANILYMQDRLSQAKKGQGETIFDMLVDMISDHNVNGVELHLL
jgi:RNAse (barnase) inhibitor barstar